ncbi:unnamed protein product [Hermetia illucens]|uniref:Uncharacterized protein n=1 Tax=Hermetia illucens TaxID=343691 RepID=A0A7R8UGR4_HERIL|nr:unnamed protein product [Hermetia illucens]
MEGENELGFQSTGPKRLHEIQECQSSGKAEVIEQGVEESELGEEEASQVAPEMEGAVDLEDRVRVLGNKFAAVRHTNKKLEELDCNLVEQSLKLEAFIMKMEA